MRKKYIVLVVFSILLAVIIPTILIAPWKPASESLKIGIPTWPGLGVVFLAQEKGFFGELEVQPIVIDETSARRAAFKSGDIDIQGPTVDAYALEAALGLEGKIILVTDESYGGDGIVVKKEITKLSELKGKTVAYTEGFVSHFLLLDLLQKEELSANDITSRTVDDPGKAAEAFISGDVDAAVTWEPFLSQAANTPKGNLLISSREAEGLIIGILVARDKAMQERRADIETFVKGWLKGLDYLKANQDESFKIMAQGFNMPLEEFTAITEALRYADLERNRKYFGLDTTEPSRVVEIFDDASSIWQESALIKSVTPSRNVIDENFLESVLTK